MDGFGIAANILPAMGFAMLGRLVLKREVMPFFFLGFPRRGSYMKVPSLGVASYCDYHRNRRSLAF